jgi:hypothetical protein
MMTRDSGALWGITCYFNPAGYGRRIVNYRTFRAQLSIPLVTVELSFDGAFELRDGDADVLVQVSGGSILWQKERLLNIGLDHIPRACRNIAWLDCDIIFADNDWADRAVEALGRCALVHLFHERHDLPRHAQVQDLPSWRSQPTAHSVVRRLLTGCAGPEDLFLANAPLERQSTAGLAWASPRAVLERHGLYDACVLGSGDRVMLCAALGRFAYGERATMMNPRQAEHYLRWAQPYHDTVRGRVGSIAGRLFHLWHGEREDRGYEERHRRLNAFAFDPFADIVSDEGTWRWSSDKPGLHAYVRRYFEERNEDGRDQSRRRSIQSVPSTATAAT